ncbi:hypothetical protein ACFZCT_03240 [Streptomyces qaidamensis]|uniref:hypothetical protein n=1 Tax=Streptomyces qaidamensis TaxID=1783515 RepID=UPI0036F18007
MGASVVIRVHLHSGPVTGPGTGQLLTIVAALLVVAYPLAAGHLRAAGMPGLGGGMCRSDGSGTAGSTNWS